MSTIDNLLQLRQWQPPYRPDALIEKGILLPRTVMMIFGAAGTWKTMNSIHLAFCIANGLSWFDFKTTQATVFSHQVELPKFIIRDRVVQYAENIKQASGCLFFKTPGDEVLLDTTIGISAIAKDIEEVQRRTSNPNLPMLLVLDPLYLHLQGHISDEYEVKKFQHNVNSLRQKYNLTVVLIHHSRLTRVDNAGQIIDLGAEEMMGSSYWNNWLDTIIKIHITNPFSGSDTVHFQFGKTRNAYDFIPGFTVQWDRSSLYPSVIDRDIIPEKEPSVRNLTE